MPYPCEHAARITDPEQYPRLRRQNDKFGAGIDAIYGVDAAGSSLQAIRFHSEHFTANDAQAWLKEKGYNPILFEPALTIRQQTEPSEFKRALGFDFSRGQLIEQDGGLLIKDVTLLAEGTWTDSGVKTALHYPAKVLQEYAANWRDTAVWSRHLGGAPRNITEKIGDVLNPHYLESARAVVGDIFLHGGNQHSRDTIEMVKRKLVNFVSVEHGGGEVYNSDTKRLESSSLVFVGAAIVNKGACKRCTLREKEAAMEAESMEIKELEDKFTKELAALKTEGAQFRSALEQATGQNKELAAKLEAAEKANGGYLEQIKTLESRLKKIEDTPNPRSLAGGSGDGERELETPSAPRIVVDRNTKETYFM